MRVISMVPSWTETLLHAGIQVVGRTRFCIHPKDQVDQIPVVGGTKEVDWSLVKDLKADLILLDEEENPREMAEASPIPYLATHVSSLQNLKNELERLGDYFRNPVLMELAVDCLDILENPPKLNWLSEVPGRIGNPIGKPFAKKQKIIYLIWKNPWMSVGAETYIGSVLSFLGADLAVFANDEGKYPVIDLEAFRDCYFLFSSEPFPFHKKQGELVKLGISGALVDGESYSWFGVRGLKFLKSLSERKL